MTIHSSQSLKKIAKGTLALVIASTFTFTSLAFADESNPVTPTIETVDLQEIQSDLETVQAETPSLIPGDFFYFAKIAFEKINLAFTVDDSKEAALLATYASERLAEAAVLFGEGDEASALEVIQTAITYMENSQKLVDTDTEVDVPADQDEEEAIVDESTPNDVVTPEDGDQTTTDEDEITEEQTATNETEAVLRHNIIALSAAMTHVGNEKAAASLQKNIDKTYAKMAKKIAKLEKKYEKKHGVKVVEDQETEDTTNEEAVDLPNVTTDPVEETSSDLTGETVIIPVEENTDVTVQQQTVVKPEINNNGQMKEKQQPQKRNNEQKSEKQHSNNGKAPQKQGNDKGNNK